MYSAAVIAAAARLLQRFARALPDTGLQRLPVTQCHAMSRVLESIYDPKKKAGTRKFSSEEDAFILNETLLCSIDFAYAAERYIWINYEGQALKPMYPCGRASA